VIRLNLGSGAYRLPAGDGWTNWDEDPETPADRHAHVPPVPYGDGSVEEVYLGHFLEHFEPEEADELLRECYRVLRPGGRLGVVVPDTRAVLAHYLAGDHTMVEIPANVHWSLDDLGSVCSVFLYSTIQESRHKWAYDERSLRAVLHKAGFATTCPLAPDDPRVSVPAWWNLGLEARKAGTADVPVVDFTLLGPKPEVQG
jgi:predicted SAM-dependent methyltransferase